VRPLREHLWYFSPRTLGALLQQHGLSCVASEGVGTPDSLGASFTLLARAGILDDDLADRMRRMNAFRNIAVHEYRRLDPAVLEAIVRERLGDLRAFAARILERAGT
jgi:uncharacterized protein YutE (UPF0331/DUF86 family)